MKSTMSIIRQFPQTITGTFTAHTRRGLFHYFNKRHFDIQTQGVAMGTMRGQLLSLLILWQT